MKTLILSTLVTLVIISGAHAQAVLHVKAGPSYSYIQNTDSKFIDRIGYAVGLDFEQYIIPALSFTGNVYYLHQASRPINVSSANVGFGFNVYPVNRLSLMTGIDMGFIINDNITEGLRDNHKQRWGYVFGVAYKMSDRINVQARYTTTINKQWFDSNSQITAGYRISKAK